MPDRPTHVPHASLRRDDLPGPRAPFEQVVQLAYTFDGYERFGMRLCGEMANRALNAFQRTAELPGWLTGDLDRLRACLYFEARRWIVLEREPDTRSLIYVHRLIAAIADALAVAEEAGEASDAAGPGPHVDTPRGRG